MKDRFIEGLVSVIIPTFNVEKYIERTINCVLSQTYKQIEIVVIDDCSSDKTKEIMLDLAKKHSNVVFAVQDENKGAAEARNKGLLMAKGQYIAFLDSDDLWEPSKIEHQIGVMINNDCAFCYCTYDFIDEQDRQLKGPIKIKEKTTYRDLLTKTMISTPTVVVDRKKLGDFLMPLRRTGQDYACWLMLLKSTDAHGIKEVLCHVRKRPGSLSKRKLQNIRDVWEVQTINERINRFSAFWHVVGYCFYALKKRIFR